MYVCTSGKVPHVHILEKQSRYIQSGRHVLTRHAQVQQKHKLCCIWTHAYKILKLYLGLLEHLPLTDREAVNKSDDIRPEDTIIGQSLRVLPEELHQAVKGLLALPQQLTHQLQLCPSILQTSFRLVYCSCYCVRHLCTLSW